MVKKVFDPISPWFIAAEALGEYIGIRFGYVLRGQAQPEWIFLRHTDCDGIGGLALILRERGAILDRLARIKHPLSPSSKWLINCSPKYIKPRRRVKWGQMEGGRQPSTSTQSPSAVAWHIFDEYSTTQIRHACRKIGVTVNSFLLKHLTKAVRPFLEDQSSVVPWMIPINLRGKVFLDRDTANFTSYVGVAIKSYETLHDVHRNIYAALETGEHWANWKVYQLTRFLTMGMRKYLLATDRAMSQWNLGSFSNLGDWDPEKKITDPRCLGGWLFAPPVLRCQLIGAGCVTFQNQLSLTIQAHPELTTNSKVAQDWIDNWVKEIQIDLDSLLPERTLSAVKTG